MFFNRTFTPTRRAVPNSVLAWPSERAAIFLLGFQDPVSPTKLIQVNTWLPLRFEKRGCSVL